MSPAGLIRGPIFFAPGWIVGGRVGASGPLHKRELAEKPPLLLQSCRSLVHDRIDHVFCRRIFRRRSFGARTDFLGSPSRRPPDPTPPATLPAGFIDRDPSRQG